MSGGNESYYVCEEEKFVVAKSEWKTKKVENERVLLVTMMRKGEETRQKKRAKRHVFNTDRTRNQESQSVSTEFPQRQMNCPPALGSVPKQAHGLQTDRETWTHGLARRRSRFLLSWALGGFNLTKVRSKHRRGPQKMLNRPINTHTALSNLTQGGSSG